MLPTLIISIIILSILIYIHINYSKENIVNKEHFIVPTDSNFLNNLTISRNKENYNLYKNHRYKILKGTNFKIGYSPVNEINEESIGFCPLGQFYKGDFKEKDLNKCKPCFDCRKEKGYYLQEGCLGDKDSVCTFGKVPREILIKSHQKPGFLHNQLPKPHEHVYTSPTPSQSNNHEHYYL